MNKINRLEEDLNQDLKQQILSANTAAHVLAMTRELDIDLPGKIAQLAQKTALHVLREAPVAVEILVVDRGGEILARV